jgi:hypothetical protein
MALLTCEDSGVFFTDPNHNCCQGLVRALVPAVGDCPVGSLCTGVPYYVCTSACFVLDQSCVSYDDFQKSTGSQTNLCCFDFINFRPPRQGGVEQN